MGQGDQSNESAFEQAKDEQISGMSNVTEALGIFDFFILFFRQGRRKLTMSRLYPRQVQGLDGQGLPHC